jgi:hypothetical protein
MKILLTVLGFIALMLLVATAYAWFVMVLLNWLITPTLLTAIFGVAKVGFWRAWGISVLTGVLFKSTSFSSSK